MTDVKSQMARVRCTLIDLVWMALDAGDSEACNAALAALVPINDAAKAKGWDLGRHVRESREKTGNVIRLDASGRNWFSD